MPVKSEADGKMTSPAKLERDLSWLQALADADGEALEVQIHAESCALSDDESEDGEVVEVDIDLCTCDAETFTIEPTPASPGV